MDYSDIRFENNDGVARIVLNRPDVLNSFNMKMSKELQDALNVAAEDSSIRAIYLTGEGRGFCAGQDLAEVIENKDRKIAQVIDEQYNPIVRLLRNIPKPIICGVNGVAAGAGANVACACDITIAIESAKFIQSFSNIGLIPDSGGTFFLPRLIGMQRSTALMFLGDKITASEAVNIGLIYKACKNDQLEEVAYGMALSLAKRPTKGFGYTKMALNKSLSNDLEAQLEVEKDLQAAAAETYDTKEGINAFLEKRKPIFKGE